MMHWTRKAFYAAVAASAVILGCARETDRTVPMAEMDASTAPLSLPDAEAYGEDVVRDLERVRAVTEKFRDIAVAHAAGFPTTVPGCLDNPPEGGMGLHYIHPERMDDQLAVERPETLVYAPTGGDAPKLVGVEYIVPFSHRGPGEEPPRIFGRALKPSAGLQLWYLHVWAWEPNSKGLFADWNPAVKC